MKVQHGTRQIQVKSWWTEYTQEKDRADQLQRELNEVTAAGLAGIAVEENRKVHEKLVQISGKLNSIRDEQREAFGKMPDPRELPAVQVQADTSDKDIVDQVTSMEMAQVTARKEVTLALINGLAKPGCFALGALIGAVVATLVTVGL